MINLVFEFGSTKSQRQIHTANPDVRNKIKAVSAFLLCQKHISLFPTVHSIFPSSWINIFFQEDFNLRQMVFFVRYALPT